MELEDVLSYVEHCVFKHAERHLSKVEKDIIRWTYDGLSYNEMAVRMQYSPGTLRAVYGFQLWKLLKQVWPNENINKSRFREVIDRICQEDLDLSRKSEQRSSISNTSDLDLRVSPERRANNLHRDTLISRLVDTFQSGCHVLLLTGAKGVGKSYLIESLSTELGDSCAQVIHHSVHEAATWQTFYQKLCIPNLSDLTGASDVITEHQMRQQVLKALAQDRYLVIVDQAERFINDSNQEIFFQEITTAINHQSSILWVSAIRPAEINRRVTVETVKGFSFDEANSFLKREYSYLSASLSEDEIHWKQLVKLCGGNPYLLDKSIETIKSFYANQIKQFTANHSLLPLTHKHINNLTGELSEAEQTLLYLFALRPLSWIDVQAWSQVTMLDNDQLIQAWTMLHRRHLLEYFSESNVICQITPPYLSLHLLQELKEIFLRELSDENLKLFHTYPLFLPTAFVEQQEILKSYLLIPLSNKLKHRFSLEDLHSKFSRLLSQLKILPLASHSYAAGSLFNLAACMELSLVDLNWTNLTLWHTDLRVPRLQGLDFQGVQFQEAVLMTGVDESFELAIHPDGTAMAIGDSQGFLQVYQWRQNRFVLDWCNALEIPIQEIIITENSKLIVVLINQNVLIWDTLTCKEEFYDDVSFSAAICSIDLKNNLLAVSLGNREIQLLNLMLGEEVSEPLYDSNGITRHLIFSPEGNFLAGYDDSSSITVWHYNALNSTYNKAKLSLPLNPYGDFLAFQWIEGQLVVIEATPDHDDDAHHLSKIAVRSFTVTEQTILGDSIDFKVEELDINFDRPYQAAFSKNGRYLAICDANLKVWVCDNTMCLVNSINLFELPTNLFVSSDGRKMLCKNTHNISVWDLEAQEIFQVWKTVSDLNQYQNCKFYTKQGFSNDELYVIQRLGGILRE